MDRDKVTRMLKMYPSYKYAVRMYEQSRGVPCASTAIYDDMPRGGAFGPRSPRVNDGISFEDTLDYMEYKHAVDAIEGALSTLRPEEQNVIIYKWVHGMTLDSIEKRFHYGIGYGKQIHRKALEKMAICLRFTDTPQIDIIGKTYKEAVNL